MIESFVDLTYRGLALGRRIKLTQVRPSTGFLELAAPMPVGSHVAIVTDDGFALDATVTWIHEQVAGSDRAPGMTVAPALAAEPAASWWRTRVSLPDDDQPRRPTRSRPVTLRPRTTTDRMPPRVDAVTDEVPTVIADLDARVAAAAGVVPAPPERADARATVAMHPYEQARLAEATRPTATVAMTALEQARLAQATRPDGEPTMRRTGEHAVVDDGQATMIMESIDPATLGIEVPGAEAAPFAVGDEPSAPVITIEAGGDPTDDDAGPDDDGDREPPASAPAGASSAGGGDRPSPSRGFKRRRKRR